jgi:thiol-disulfide isomerase/thioredoxin
MVPAGEGDVDALVRSAIADADRAGDRVIVYVGAKWCEPCQYFKKALAAGKLDQDFHGIRFLEFDHDHDEKRLVAASYDGELIPRFVVPARDGRGSNRRIEGSIKGPGAVAEISPRLKALLGHEP